MFIVRRPTALGDVAIKTTDDLSGMEEHLLIHPWISPPLDQDFSRRTAGLDDTTARTASGRSSQAAFWSAVAQTAIACAV